MNILDKLDVTYQHAFTASEKPSSVPPAAYISPLREKYWDVQAKLLTEKMDGTDKDKIREAVSQLKYEDEAYHERMIARLINEYDDYSSSCEGDGTTCIHSIRNIVNSTNRTLFISITRKILGYAGKTSYRKDGRNGQGQNS